MTSEVFNLRSIYRSVRDQSSTFRQQSSPFEQMTPGICDYIPSGLFNKQFLSILIEGEAKQIVHNILWNQFYSKTLLKQICENITKKQNSESMMINVWNKRQQTFLKTGNSIFNVKDKLQYENAQLIQDKIMKSKQLLIQTFSDQGHWKKVNIQIGPYKQRKFYDVVFLLHQTTNTEQKQTTIRKSIKNMPSSAKKINIDKNSLKDIKIKDSTQKKSKSSIVELNSKINRKQSTTNEKQKNLKSNKSKNSVKQNNFVESQKKVSVHSLYNTLKQTNFNNFDNINSWNNTQKLFVNQKLNFNQDQPIQACLNSLSLKRKNNTQKQNKFKQPQEVFQHFDRSIQIKQSLQNAKNTYVLTQIIQKKDQIINNQKKRIQQLQAKYENDLDAVRIYAQQKVKTLQEKLQSVTFQNQSNKVKFCSENQSLNQIILNLKESIMKKGQIQDILTLKVKQLADKSEVQIVTIQQMRQKQREMRQKYQKLMIDSKAEAMSLFKQMQSIWQQKQKLEAKYKSLLNKVKSLTQQTQS